MDGALALSLVGLDAPVPIKLCIQASCRFCKTEFVPNRLTNACNYHLLKRVLRGMKRYKRHYVRRNSWVRRLHTEDEVILPFA